MPEELKPGKIISPARRLNEAKPPTPLRADNGHYPRKSIRFDPVVSIITAAVVKPVAADAAPVRSVPAAADVAPVRSVPAAADAAPVRSVPVAADAAPARSVPAAADAAPARSVAPLQLSGARAPGCDALFKFGGTAYGQSLVALLDSGASGAGFVDPAF